MEDNVQSILGEIKGLNFLISLVLGVLVNILFLMVRSND